MSTGRDLVDALFDPPEGGRPPDVGEPPLDDDEIARAVPFTVFTHGEVGHWWIDRPRGGVEAHGGLTWNQREVPVRERAAPGRRSPLRDATTVRRGGLECRIAEVAADGAGGAAGRVLVVRLGGTEVRLGPSSAGAASLVALALALRPAGGPPPVLVDG